MLRKLKSKASSLHLRLPSAPSSWVAAPASNASYSLPRNSFTDTDYYRTTKEEIHSPVSWAAIYQEQTTPEEAASAASVSTIRLDRAHTLDIDVDADGEHSDGDGDGYFDHEETAEDAVDGFGSTSKRPMRHEGSRTRSSSVRVVLDTVFRRLPWRKGDCRDRIQSANVSFSMTPSQGLPQRQRARRQRHAILAGKMRSKSMPSFF
ncbi:hypothetical protein C8F01DRAFT_1360472 [Mycena amicta]|nr:hypothetical protein C8F01DRAFT_1360472 [Mycena amicta]